MNFGMFTDFHVGENKTQAEAFDESFAQIDAAESMGFDTVWLAEHHFSPERAVLASPMVIASAIAARTQRIRTGLAVQVLPLTNPLRVAEEAATVDHISKGRFEFGIGRSGLTKYYEGYNVPYSESRPRFLEALEIIMKAWNSDEFSHEGEFHSYQDVTVVPKPFQQPYEAGHTGTADIAIRIPVYAAETTEQAHSEPEASAMSAIQYAASELVKTAASEETAERIRRTANTPYADVLRQRVVFGTPEEIVERFQGYQADFGVTGVVMEVNYGFETRPYVCAHV